MTYLDSMLADVLLNEPDSLPESSKVHAGLTCLSEVYRIEELQDLIDEFGIPEGTYMEAQVWADAPLEPYKELLNQGM